MNLTSFLAPFVLVCAALSPALAGTEPTARPTARDVVEAGLNAHGGEAFIDPQTLQLSGTATFYDPATGAVRSAADDYRMWREFERGRTVSHGADGKVRILAKSGERVLFEVGYDGETTWTQNGIMPKDQADAYWANNFGFGIIRSALDEGFTLSHAPRREVSGHEVHLVRITDPGGQETLFGFDAESGFIRYMAFDSPRGFHERIYDDFSRLPEIGWVQAGSITLRYDGVVSNTVRWTSVVVGEAIDEAVFTPPMENDE